VGVPRPLLEREWLEAPAFTGERAFKRGQLHRDLPGIIAEIASR
jgi:hypothetical protein